MESTTLEKNEIVSDCETESDCTDTNPCKNYDECSWCCQHIKPCECGCGYLGGSCDNWDGVNGVALQEMS